MRQKLSDPIDGMGGNAAEDIFEPSEWINSSTLAGSDEAAQHGSRSTADIAAEKQPVATTYCHHASILPISGMKLRFTIVGTRFTVDDCGCSTANNVRAAGLSMSKWHPAL
jgi:hypothetical protein